MNAGWNIEIGLLITLITALIAVAGWLRGRDGKVSSDSEWKGTVNAKLDILPEIQKDLAGLRGELRGQVAALENEISSIKERLIVVEQSTKSAHKRIDDVVKIENE